MARLVVDTGPDEGMVFPLSEGVTTMGRSPSNSIQVTDRRASRFHAEIVRRGVTYRLRDLGSKNGTSVKGVRVTDELTLTHGDQIRIGQALYVFEHEEQTGVARPKAATKSSSAIRLADDVGAQRRGSVPAGGVTHILEGAVDRKEPAKQSDTQKRLSVLLQVIEKVRSVLDLDQLLREIMDLIFDVLTPERGLIMLIDQGSGALVPRVIKSSGEQEEISISRTIVHQALRERMSLLISDAAADERFQAAESIVAQRIRTAICAPLISKENTLGVVYIDSRLRQAAFGQQELELLTAIADQAAFAISNALMHESLLAQNRLERELEIARAIQTNLLPKQPPLIPGFDIAAMTVPAKRVGGDYFDFIQIDPDHLGVAVADVSGKGVPAAIMTASIRAALQIEARRPENRLEQILSNLNEMTCRDATNNMFVAVFFGILQLSSRRLRYVNAGHCYPIVLDAEGRETRLDKGGCVLGVMPGRQFEQGEIRLAPHSTLVIYSDGVTDILNDKEEAFGLDRLLRLVAENTDATAEGLRQTIFAATTQHRGKTDQFDDYTLVIVKTL